MENKVPALLNPSLLSTVLFAIIFIALPVWGFAVWYATGDQILSIISLFPALIYVGVGLLFFTFLLIATSLQKSIYLWRVLSVGFAFFYLLVLGNWIIFTSILAASLKSIFYQPLIYLFSGVFFLVLYMITFLKYFSDFKANELQVVNSLHIENGVIDPSNARVHSDTIEANQMANSPFVLPVKLFFWLGIPLGGGGCALMMNHIGASSQMVIIAFGVFSTLIIGIISCMPSYFAVYVFAYLQIKHRKWFKVISR